MNSMRGLVVVPLICLLALASANIATSQRKSSASNFVSAFRAFQAWERYKVKGDEFSVSLPALPAMTSSKTLIAPQILRTERLLGSYAEGVAYAIYTFENPQDQTLDEFVEQTRMRWSRTREWTNPTDLAMNGFSPFWVNRTCNQSD